MFFALLLILNQFSLSANPTVNSEIDVSTGLGGIVWETETQPQINSNIGIAFGYRMEWKNDFWFGGNLLINAYSGDSQYHRGPGASILQFMLYKKLKLDMWTVLAGAGLSSNIVLSSRTISNDPTGIPDGNYSIIRPGIGSGFQIMLVHRIQSSISIILSFIYNTSYYVNTCWEGPVTDCSEVDPFMQQWFISAGITYSFNALFPLFEY